MLMCYTHDSVHETIHWYHYCLWIVKSLTLYVTGFWKTDQIVTLGQFHFIGQTNGHTRTLCIHSVSIRLDWLVCFSRATFANPVNTWLRQWDPWRALHGSYGPEIHPRDRETSITPFKHVWAYGWLFWDS